MADKPLQILAGTITEVDATVISTGAPNAGDIVALDGTGHLDPSVMPPGIVPDTASVQASENLAAGDLVNIHNVAGAFRVRKADATTAGKQADGFVLSAVLSGANASVYFEGPDNQVSGLTPGVRFLATTAGGSTSTAPSASGNVVQRVGVATSATVLNYEGGVPVVLA